MSNHNIGIIDSGIDTGNEYLMQYVVDGIDVITENDAVLIFS